MASYRLPEDLRDALMAYLRGQPYGTVVEGMKALEGLEKIDETPKKGLEGLHAAVAALDTCKDKQ